ncbi:DUF2254 family protein [Paenibacillus sp.]|uniref:DUF2254 family protein n=1 Tax=Paenibacillus sp. TaxID=58172 RepID=UPI002D67A8BD|nr:DUF2254 family protein [Paenibacillus sp.]HZG86097.1 DUF2254 family protein [Paenibacillus sp.]
MMCTPYLSFVTTPPFFCVLPSHNPSSACLRPPVPRHDVYLLPFFCHHPSLLLRTSFPSSSSSAYAPAPGTPIPLLEGGPTRRAKQKGLPLPKDVDASVAVLFALICLLFFVYFIHQVSKFIRVNTLIQIVSEKAVTLIHAFKTVGTLGESELTSSTPAAECLTIYSEKEGYLNFVDFLALERAIKRKGYKELKILLIPKVGQYIRKRAPLMEIRGHSTLSEEFQKKLANAVKVSPVRSNEQDIAFVMEKIIETGLRAISPGINDPNTAIYCIRALGILLAKLGSWKGSCWIVRGKGYILEIPYFTFEDFLYKTFYQLRLYGAHDVSVMHALLESLTHLAEELQEGRETVQKIGNYVYSNIDPRIMHDLDRNLIVHAKQRLDHICQTS